MSASGRSEIGTLLLGPGARTELLGPVMRALDADSGGVAIERLRDLEELGRGWPAGTTLVLDVDDLDPEDLGFVRRFQARLHSSSIVALGTDPQARVARALQLRGATRWLAWPPDVVQLQTLLAEVARAGPRPERSAPAPSRDVGRASGHETHAARVAPPSADVPEALVRTPLERAEIEEIQAILSGRAPAADKPAGRAPALQSSTSDVLRPHAPPHAQLQDGPEPARAAPRRESSATAARPAHAAREPRGPLVAGRHLREQIADLADFAQRIELSLQAARELTTPAESARRFDELDVEVARLVQFARTLGYLVAPPGAGEQEFDLCELVHTTVAGAASRPDAPRCQFRTSGTALVRSDRRLLAQAFDAFFFLAARCTGTGELLRAQVRREHEGGADRARVTIEFPAGPLDGLPLEQVLEPYGLRRTLPDLGPNALSAAVAILEGQGGQADLHPGSKGRLEWRIELPAVPESSLEPAARARGTAVGSGGGPD